MNIAKKILNRAVHRAGFELVKLPPKLGELPAGAAEHLRIQNPELQALFAAYADCDPKVTSGFQWKRRTIPARDLTYFRGDTAYVWQRESDASYALTARYVSAIDSEGLLSRLSEDGLFGARAVEVDGREVSRDLLDSVLELLFLSRHGVRPKTVLDVGAGYGRLAHRMTEIYPECEYVCADAVPFSTFLSRYYLSFRASQAKVVSLPDFTEGIADLAVNIHSFTECTKDAVEWWLDRLKAPYLMVVPNAIDHGGTKIINSQGHDLMPIIESRGYELVVREPKYADPVVQRHGIQPTCYYLFHKS